MTTTQYYTRFAFYALAAFLTPVASNWAQMEHATLFQWGGMFVQATAAAIIAMKAFISTSSSEVRP